MVTKVGSAGHIVDSVIQYPQSGGSKPETNSDTERVVKKSNAKATNAANTANTANTTKANAASNANAPDKKPSLSNAVAIQSVADQEEEALEKRGGDVLSDERHGFGLSEEAIKITVDEVNKKLEPVMSEVQVSFHEKTGRYSFKLLDKKTGEIIKEVPPKDSLDMVAKMFEMAGLIVDERL